jgi:hypothetical protein
LRSVVQVSSRYECPSPMKGWQENIFSPEPVSPNSHYFQI